MIKTIHKEGFQDILLQEAGQYRTIQVTYSSKEAPHYSRIAEMMKILCDDTEYSIEHLPEIAEDNFITRVIELLSNFQHRFVFIHPFVDYNGRTARMFTSYILMRLNLPIVEIQVENNTERQNYIKALQKADEHNYSYLETIIADALNESLQKVTKV
ncbi:Fic family protein [Candidatus Woesebacteria bacterium]|nr:Fic family protein [Candidatus Woesebacteria bacterium]